MQEKGTLKGMVHQRLVFSEKAEKSDPCFSQEIFTLSTHNFPSRYSYQSPHCFTFRLSSGESLGLQAPILQRCGSFSSALLSRFNKVDLREPDGRTFLPLDRELHNTTLDPSDSSIMILPGQSVYYYLFLPSLSQTHPVIWPSSILIIQLTLHCLKIMFSYPPAAPGNLL